MTLSRTSRWLLAAAMVLGLAFVYVPLFIVVVNSFNTSRLFAWPPPGFTTEWWSAAFQNEGVRSAFVTSILVALIATFIALILGTLTAMAVSRYDFWGRHTISLLFVLPIALPGIVTGIALYNVFTSFLGGLTFVSLVMGHATFCVVVVLNNAAARLRRTLGNIEEAAMDLGATRMRTFRDVTFPAMRSALLAGGLLAFGLSFDEIVVTTFTAGSNIQTLPIWIFQNLFRPYQAPIVNVVAAVLVIVSAVPIWFAQKLSGSQAEGLTASP
jgi:putative spermidine/putrescine transport system permease protein